MTVEEKMVSSSTRRLTMGCGNLYLIVDHPQGRPLRLSIKKGHGGLCEQALLEAVDRLLTILMQRTDVDMRMVCRSLTGITCDQGMVGRVSCVDVLAKHLREWYPEEKKGEAYGDHGR